MRDSAEVQDNRGSGRKDRNEKIVDENGVPGLSIAFGRIAQDEGSGIENERKGVIGELVRNKIRERGSKYGERYNQGYGDGYPERFHDALVMWPVMEFVLGEVPMQAPVQADCRCT